jgi:hypothetical protein
MGDSQVVSNVRREEIMRDAATVFVSEKLCAKAMGFLRSHRDEWAKHRETTSEFKLSFTDDHYEFVTIYEDALEGFVSEQG